MYGPYGLIGLTDPNFKGPLPPGYSLTPPTGLGPVARGGGAVIRQGLNTTPAANDQNRSRLKAPPGADMKNRLIYKQR